MSYTTTQGKALNLNEKHHSDGTELIPAEVQANVRQDAAPTAPPFASGYTVSDEGLLNNYAIEPEIYPSTFPSPPQQRRYIFLGAGAILLVSMLLLITLAIS